MKPVAYNSGMNDDDDPDPTKPCAQESGKRLGVIRFLSALLRQLRSSLLVAELLDACATLRPLGFVLPKSRH